MKIKTLAQILAENPSTSEGSSKKSQRDSKPSKTNKKPWATKAAAQGFAASDSSTKARFKKNQAKQSDNQSGSDIDTDSIPQSRSKYSENRTSNRSNTESDGHYFEDSEFFDAAINGLNKADDAESTTQPKKRRKKKKTFHPASPYQPKIDIDEPIKEVDPNSIKSLLAQVKAEGEQREESLANNIDIDASHSNADASSIDNLPSALKAYLRTPEERQAEVETIKANSRLRWLAFYYLSRREHSAGELRQKLLDKEQDPAKIDELLEEFSEKGYQSDYRTALMLIREGIRKRRGRVRIKNDFYKRKVDMPANIDELIDMAMEENEAFVDVVSENTLVEGVDWLRLAVEARVKKYGDAIPSEQKDKAKQLRFLQYRGFKPNICFEAINHNLDTLDDRF